MKSAKDIIMDTERPIKAYVVGDPGTGKSVFASTFPGKGFVFDFDNGIESYRGKDFDYESFTLDATGWVYFEKTLIEVKKAVLAGEYKTVVLDSTTTMTDLAMERAMQLDPKRSATNGPLWNVHYQMVKNLMEGRLRQIINMPCNVVVLGHLEVKMNQESGAVISIEPLLTGQLSTKIPGYFDEVYYTKIKQKEGKSIFQLQTVAKGFLKARSRLRGVEEYLEDFVPNDYPSIMKMLVDKSSKANAKK
jgi:hypothetical protein